MTDEVFDTLTWYNQRAAQFAAQTADLDMGALHERFLRHVRPGGRILDAGCGTGRDAVAFARSGFLVTAFDASAEMVRVATERSGPRVTVKHMRFEEVDWRGEFDGIWACASLLHVPRGAFKAVALRLCAALKPAGAWYMSFKFGQGERVSVGRLFIDHTDAEKWVNAVMLRN